MKERPILFNGDMVNAVLEDRKTVTRRVIKPQPRGMRQEFYRAYDNTWGYTTTIPGDGSSVRTSPIFLKCSYGKPNDKLYIKEPHYLFGHWGTCGVTKTGKWKWRFSCNRKKGVMFPDNPPEKICPTKVRGSTIGPGWFKRTPLFMPKWAARHWLGVMDIRVEEVQEITESGIKAEGVIPDLVDSGGVDQSGKWAEVEDWYNPWIHLWDSINGGKHGRSWSENPWCWVVSFRRID